MATENKECAVCCEAFNKTTHTRIACEHNGVCAFEACKACVRTYLLGTTSDPNCMQCNKAWSDKFLAQKLNSSFMRTEYSSHRKELLVQGQLSRMPETMAAAETYKRVSAIEAQMKELKNLHTEANNQVNVLYEKISELQRNDIFGDQLKKTKDELKKTRETQSMLWGNIRVLKHNILLIKNGGAAIAEEKKEVKKFIMPCTNSDCRGFLSTQYKCELCEHHTCSKCFEHIGPVKDEDAHTCKPENIESAEFIRKQSKPCPCCGTRISKIDGCDQMWCTQCHKAFSWNTGKVVTGTVHNPHFYQWQRENGGGIAPRNPGDVVCGGLCDSFILNQHLLNALTLPKMTIEMKEAKKSLIDLVLSIHRFQRHFTAINIEPLRRQIRQEENYEQERIQYIVQEITREELATKIIRKDNARKKQVAVLHVCELFTTVAIDMFAMIVTSQKKGLEFADELKKHIGEYDALRQYCNAQFKEIGMIYGVCVPQISEKWTEDTSKFTAKGETDKYIEKREALRKERKIKEEKRMLQFQKEQEERNRIYRAEQEKRQKLLEQTLAANK